MWSAQRESLSGMRGIRYSIHRGSQPTTYAGVVDAWQQDAGFRQFFITLLADTDYTAFRWELPAVTTETISQPFEFVLLDCPGLDRRVDPDAFAAFFNSAESGVAVFPNLGRDAIMIVPCPIVDSRAYGHLAAFVRLAPENQRHTFWQVVGKTIVRRIRKEPVWLSTAGFGVSWLHVRLDDRPKYYGYEPYKRI